MRLPPWDLIGEISNWPELLQLEFKLVISSKWRVELVQALAGNLTGPRSLPSCSHDFARYLRARTRSRRPGGRRAMESGCRCYSARSAYFSSDRSIPRSPPHLARTMPFPVTIKLLSIDGMGSNGNSDSIGRKPESGVENAVLVSFNLGAPACKVRLIRNAGGEHSLWQQ